MVTERPPGRASRGPSATRPRGPARPASRLRLRLVAFAGVAVLVAGAAAWLLWPSSSPAAGDETAASQTVQLTMAGFQPARLEACFQTPFAAEQLLARVDHLLGRRQAA